MESTALTRLCCRVVAEDSTSTAECSCHSAIRQSSPSIANYHWGRRCKSSVNSSWRLSSWIGTKLNGTSGTIGQVPAVLCHSQNRIALSNARSRNHLGSGMIEYPHAKCAVSLWASRKKAARFHVSFQSHLLCSRRCLCRTSPGVFRGNNFLSFPGQFLKFSPSLLPIFNTCPMLPVRWLLLLHSQSGL